MATELFELVGKITVDAADAINKIYNVSGLLNGLVSGAKDFAVNTLKTGMGFDYQMSAVQAVLGKTEGTQENMNKLRAFGLEVAKDSIFTAEETATAYYYMGMAGWKTEQMISGLPGIIALAAAADEDLATTSDIVTDSLTAFGYGADQATRFANVLAAAATNSNTDVSRMGATFKYVAPVAGALGYSIEDVAISIGLMASAGIKGSQAGTGLRNIFSRIATNAGETKNNIGALTVLQEKLGVSFYDSSKRARPWLDVLTDARKAWGQLDPEKQKEVALAFGQVSTEGMTLDESMSMLNESLDDWETKWTGASKTKEYAEFMKDLEPVLNDLNISTRNNNGELLDFTEVAKSARRHVSELTDEEKIWYAERIGNLRAMPGWIAMMEASDEEFIKIRDSIFGAQEGEGAAQWAANTRLDNLLGDIKKFNSALDVLKISIYDDVKGPLREVVQFGTGAINRIRIAFTEGGFEAGIEQLGTEISTFTETYGPKIQELAETIAPLLSSVLTLVAPPLAELALTVGESIGNGLIAGIAGALTESGDTGAMGAIKGVAGNLLSSLFFTDPENPSAGNIWGTFGKGIFLNDWSGLSTSRPGVKPASNEANVTSQTVADTYTDLGFEYTGSVVKLGEFEFDPVALGSAAQEALNSPNATFTIGEGENSLQISTDYAQGILDFLSAIGVQAGSQLSTDIGTSIETGGTGGASGMANAITSAGAGAASSVGNAIQAAISGRSYSINVSANVTGLPKNTTTEKHAKSMATGSILRGATVFGMNAEGQLMSGGESGAEAVIGVNSLNRMIQSSVNNAMMTKDTGSKTLSNTMRDSVAAGMSDYSTSFIDQLVARLSEVINAAVASIASRPNVVYMNGKSAAKQMADYNAVASSSRNRSIATGYGVAGLHKNTVNLMR